MLWAIPKSAFKLFAGISAPYWGKVEQREIYISSALDDFPESLQSPYQIHDFF